MKALKDCFWDLRIHKWVDAPRYYWEISTEDENSLVKESFVQHGYSDRYEDCFNNFRMFANLNDFGKYKLIIGED